LRLCTSTRILYDSVSHRILVDENPVRHRVVLDVARLPSESDRRDSMARRVEDRLDAAALIRDEHVTYHGVVGEAIRILACRRMREKLSGAPVERDRLVGIRR